MSRSADRHSLKRALAVSIALHIVMLPLVVVLLSLYIGTGTLDDADRRSAGSTISYLTIERRLPRPAPVSRAARRTAERPSSPERVIARPTAEPVKKPLVAVTSPRRTAVAVAEAAVPATNISPAASQRRAEVPEASVLPAAAPSPVEAPRSPAPSPPVTPSLPPPAPTATPAPAQQQIATRGIDIPAGGWGQSFERPLVADDTALAALRARYHAARAVSIEVDETGHALRVSVPSDVPEDIRAELERRLLELRYVPAECNGLRCGATLRLEM